jgi:hypothetical protein
MAAWRMSERTVTSWHAPRTWVHSRRVAAAFGVNERSGMRRARRLRRGVAAFGALLSSFPSASAVQVANCNHVASASRSHVVRSQFD